MPTARFTYPAQDGLDITAYRWDPEGKPRGIAQITHGLGDHALRYEELAQTLAESGLVVYAQDHRGHGATALSDEAVGDLGEGGWAGLLDDIDRLMRHARAEHPGLPLLLLGHSLGSFAMQQYLLDHAHQLDGAVLIGTTALDQLEPALDLDGPVKLEFFNAAFQPARTDFDWLTRDESIVDAYIADPRCGFGLAGQALKDMFAGARRLADPTQFAAIPRNLPLYLTAGEKDPINGNLALFNVVADRYQAAGLTDITIRVYPDARHEILNETNRAEVLSDLLGWVSRVLEAHQKAGAPSGV